MLKRANRFHGRGSLRFVYKHGRVVRTDLLALKYNKNIRRQNYRSAVIVSRKIHHSAVTRNRIRRRIYAILRQLNQKIKQPYDLVFTVTSAEIVDLPTEELEKQIKDLLKRAKITAITSDIIEPKET